ncbi:MAG TPA: lysylphosphatidylglycerol synthase transmembrane domain-containing protein [Blastocatellia bacterium]|nr:lysylphosphatidylglycerol synthase transmembrane domain-containing protein [Blastocatellia bacterium]
MDEVTATFDEVVARPANPSMQWVELALGYMLAAVGLIWVLHDFQLGHLRPLVANLRWLWIALAIVCAVTSYICQGARWRLLLKPLGKISTLRATQAVYAGLFTNEILPMRMGELVRAYLVSRWTAAKFVAVIPSMVAERLFDALWLAVGIGLTAVLVPLPRDLLRVADLLGAGVVIAAAVLCYFILRPPKPHRFSSGPLRFASLLVEGLSSGLQGIAGTRAFYLSLIGSLLPLVFEALAFWLVMLGCSLHLSFWVGVAVYLIVRLGTAVPNAPANVGSYQFFTVVGLTLFGVDKTAATGFSLVVFVLLTLPLLILGFMAMSANGTSLMKIRRDVRELANS